MAVRCICGDRCSATVEKGSSEFPLQSYLHHPAITDVCLGVCRDWPLPDINRVRVVFERLLC